MISKANPPKTNIAGNTNNPINSSLLSFGSFVPARTSAPPVLKGEYPVNVAKQTTILSPKAISIFKFGIIGKKSGYHDA